MQGLGRVDEEGRRAGGGQRGGDLAAHMAALAHAHDGDAAAAAQHQLHRSGEGVAQDFRTAGYWFEQAARQGRLGERGHAHILTGAVHSVKIASMNNEETAELARRARVHAALGDVHHVHL